MRSRIFCWIPLLLLPSCGSESAPAVGLAPGEERWLLQTVVLGPEGRNSYVQVLPGLEQVVEPGTSRARELAGNARTYFDGARVFLGAPETLSITRQELDGGELRDEQTVSMQGTGLSYLPLGNVFVSREKAYLFDGFESVGQVWNPSTMERGGELDLSTLRKDGLDMEINGGLLRDGLLFLQPQHLNVTSLKFFRGIQVAIVDPEKDQIVDVIEDERCVGGRTEPVLGEDGTIYVLGDNYIHVARLKDPTIPASCMLRILPGQRVFDPGWQFTMSEATGGREASGLIHGGGDVFYTTVLYPEQLGQSFEENPLGFFEQPAARWWKVRLSEGKGEELPGMPFFSVGTAVGHATGGRVFLQTPTASFKGMTTVWEAPREGAPQERLRIDGLAPMLARLP
jgi:hypothetical protein